MIFTTQLAHLMCVTLSDHSCRSYWCYQCHPLIFYETSFFVLWNILFHSRKWLWESQILSPFPPSCYGWCLNLLSKTEDLVIIILLPYTLAQFHFVLWWSAAPFSMVLERKGAKFFRELHSLCMRSVMKMHSYVTHWQLPIVPRPLKEEPCVLDNTTKISLDHFFAECF